MYNYQSQGTFTFKTTYDNLLKTTGHEYDSLFEKRIYYDEGYQS